MDGWQIGYSVALTIGALIVGWCALRVESLLQRVAVLEDRANECTCKKDGICDVRLPEAPR